MRNDVQMILKDLGYVEHIENTGIRIFIATLPTAIGPKDCVLRFNEEYDFIFCGHYYSEGRNIIEADFPKDLQDLDEDEVLMFFHKIYQKIHKSYAQKLHIEHGVS